MVKSERLRSHNAPVCALPAPMRCVIDDALFYAKDCGPHVLPDGPCALLLLWEALGEGGLGGCDCQCSCS